MKQLSTLSVALKYSTGRKKCAAFFLRNVIYRYPEDTEERAPIGMRPLTENCFQKNTEVPPNDMEAMQNCDGSGWCNCKCSRFFRGLQGEDLDFRMNNESY